MDFKKNINIILALVALIVLVFVLYFAFFNKEMFGIRGQQNENELALDTIVINIQGGDFSHVKVDLSLEGGNLESSKIMKGSRQYIRKMMINLLAQQNGRELLKEKSKIKLKNQIKKEIEQSVGVHVKDVYFRNFVLAP